MGLFVSPITLVLGIILALIFNVAITKDNNMNQVWMLSMFLGTFLGLMNFGFQLRGSRPSYTDAYSGKNDLFKRSMIYFFLRIISFGAIFALVAMNQFTSESPRFNLIPTGIGYALHFLVLLVVFTILNFKGKKADK
ncbi:MAG: hypothetical protein K6G28_03845 [Acholeplasmatales bacterium]|nr:hypothetical protein [Acholeplasmatales bacterium]